MPGQPPILAKLALVFGVVLCSKANARERRENELLHPVCRVSRVSDRSFLFQRILVGLHSHTDATVSAPSIMGGLRSTGAASGSKECGE